MEKFVKILKKLFPFTIILILVYFVPPIFILVQQEEEVIERMLTADLMILNPGISFIAFCSFMASLFSAFCSSMGWPPFLAYTLEKA